MPESTADSIMGERRVRLGCASAQFGAEKQIGRQTDRVEAQVVKFVILLSVGCKRVWTSARN